MKQAPFKKWQIVAFVLLVIVGAVAIISKAPVTDLLGLQQGKLPDVDTVDEEIEFLGGLLEDTRAQRDTCLEELDACDGKLEAYREQADQCVAEKLEIKDNR